MQAPTLEEIRNIAEQYRFQLSQEEEEVFYRFIRNSLDSYKALDLMEEPKLIPANRNRDSGRRPSSIENPYNAWAWRCSIEGSTGGKLAGKKLGIKDTVSLAGIPLSNGSKLLENYIPDVDATIVKRILDSGGKILGKTVCEDLCFSGGSHTSYPLPVSNPHNKEYQAGGSSSGSAVVVSIGEVEMAIGGDQGGSIRIPSSWCGIFGLKPTWGLVPYTGVFPIELTLDHVGPMAANVQDLAILLEVIAGRDGLDPRQAETPTTLPSYATELQKGIRGFKIGIVKEGFGWPNLSDPEVDRLVLDAAHLYENEGASVEEISIPFHRDAVYVWAAIINEGSLSMMIRGRGMGHNWKGYYDSNLLGFYGDSQKSNANSYPPTVKAVILLSHFLDTRFNGKYYSKAQNLRRPLTEAYNTALNEYDLLIMPTTPQKPTKLKQNSLQEYVDNALNNLNNTSPFNVSGLPAINIPCGFSGGLPIGMMAVGRRFEESVVLRAAYSFEKMNRRK